jgi:hypothetical protein
LTNVNSAPPRTVQFAANNATGKTISKLAADWQLSGSLVVFFFVLASFQMRSSGVAVFETETHLKGDRRTDALGKSPTARHDWRAR